MAKSKKQLKPVDMEKRLATAYDQGYYDGFVAAAETTHKIWVDISESTKGIGPKRRKAFIDRAFEVMREKSSDKFGKPPEYAEDVRAELNNVTEDNKNE